MPRFPLAVAALGFLAAAAPAADSPAIVKLKQEKVARLEKYADRVATMMNGLDFPQNPPAFRVELGRAKLALAETDAARVQILEQMLADATAADAARAKILEAGFIAGDRFGAGLFLAEAARGTAARYDIAIELETLKANLAAPQGEAKPAEPAAGDLAGLLRERAKLLRSQVADVKARVDGTLGRPQELYAAEIAALQAEAEAAAEPADRVARLTQAVAIARRNEAAKAAARKADIAPPADLVKAKLARLDVEIELARAKAK